MNGGRKVDALPLKTTTISKHQYLFNSDISLKCAVVEISEKNHVLSHVLVFIVL